MGLIFDAQLLKIMVGVGFYFPKLVKEFIVNLSSGFNNAKSIKYRKVHVRGHFFLLTYDKK